LTAIAAGIALVVLAGLASVFPRPGSRVAARLHAVVVAAATIACTVPALRVLRSGESLALALPWPVPGGALLGICLALHQRDLKRARWVP